MARLRKLVRAVERGTSSFGEVYNKIDQIEKMVAESDSEEEETPKKYIKPIQGLLENYQKSMDRLREENKRLCMAAQSNRENRVQNGEPISHYNSHQITHQTSHQVSHQTTNTIQTYKEPRKDFKQHRPASNPSKSIKELDA